MNWFSCIGSNYLSTKTRIETFYSLQMSIRIKLVLITYPLKQGLKHFTSFSCCFLALVLITYPLKQGLKHFIEHYIFKHLIGSNYLSTKTRIETSDREQKS
ncbi:conserved hypothetical protein [Candidatus Magnetomoraceae bacterium gMMP-15]